MRGFSRIAGVVLLVFGVSSGAALGGPPPEGACCQNDKTCEATTSDGCDILGGNFLEGVDCGPVTYCAKPDGTVELSAEACCVKQEGIADVPTVSEWGLVALTLVLLTAGAIVLRRRAVAA